MKIGVVADCFKTNLADSLRSAAKLNIQGVQIYATSGEFSPEVLTPEKKAEFMKLLGELGLTLSALCGDLGGHGFEIAADNRLKIPATKAIIDLAAELGCHVVTTHIGVIPDKVSSLKYVVMLDALDELGKYAKER